MAERDCNPELNKMLDRFHVEGKEASDIDNDWEMKFVEERHSEILAKYGKIGGYCFLQGVLCKEQIIDLRKAKTALRYKRQDAEITARFPYITF